MALQIPYDMYTKHKTSQVIMWRIYANQNLGYIMLQIVNVPLDKVANLDGYELYHPLLHTENPIDVL